MLSLLPRLGTRLLFVVVVSAAAAFGRDAGWKKVTAANFTVITPVDDSDAVALAGEFSQFVAALHGFIPVNEARLPKLTMVVFGRERDFDAYRPLRADGKPEEVGGFFWRCDSWAIAALPGASLDEETRHTFFHESTHWYVSAFNLPNPVWLEEGLAEVFSTFKIEGKKVRWGDAIAAHVVQLNATAPMPLEQLLFLPQSELFSGGSEGEERTGMAYAESWAFVHYLIFGQSEVPPQALNDYVRLLRTMNPDAAFQQAFGHSYTDVDRKLRDYLYNGRYRVVLAPAAPVPAFKVEPAAPMEVEEALGKVALAGGRNAEAMTHARAAIKAAPDKPNGYELLGRASQAGDDDAGAAVAFQQAVDRHSHDAHAYFAVAAIRQQQIMAEDPSGHSLSAEEARRLGSCFERAINLNPLFESAYAGLAGLADVLPPPNDEDAAFIGRGAMLFPRNPLIRLGQAALDHKAGRNDQAQRTIAEVVASPDTSDKIRAYAQRLQAGWGEKDVATQINDRVQRRKYIEALALLDQELAHTSDMMTGMRLRQMRQMIAPYAKNEEAVKAFREHRWSDARKLLNEVLASNAQPTTKTQARGRLRELDRRHLGIGGASSQGNADEASGAPDIAR